MDPKHSFIKGLHCIDTILQLLDLQSDSHLLPDKLPTALRNSVLTPFYYFVCRQPDDQ